MITEAQLKSYIREQAFILHYLPVIELSNSKMVGVEALLRLRLADNEMLLPDQFLPVAESSGLLNELGEWVLKTASEQHKHWLKAGVPQLSIGINLSYSQVFADDFSNTYLNHIELAGLPDNSISLEVNKSVFDDASSRIDQLYQLQNAGIKIIVDNYGTGVADVTSLNGLPVDTIKIDRSIIKEIETSADDRNLIKTIIQTARDNHFDVIAEGVETMEQLEFLELTGCNFVQGFLFDHPLEAESINAMFDV